MESIQIATTRQTALQEWLSRETGRVLNLQPMRGDASFRRYFRVIMDDQSFVVMDAPPPENCAAFVAIAKVMRQIGLHAPEVMAMDINQGFLLLTDFGDQTYLSILATHNANTLYQTALQALAVLQDCHAPELNLPFFSTSFMWQEWVLHKDWFIKQWLELDIQAIECKLDKGYGHLVASASQQPQVFMHRDYHSGNLMRLPNHQVGLLDFQDAFIGPVTYDLVSLLRDCYIDWPQAMVLDWINDYRQLLSAHSADRDTFQYWFDLMGIQRHLKALMTFSRKALRDGQNSYLAFIPRTVRYIIDVSHHYSILADLHHFMLTQVQPAVERKCS